MSLGTIPPFFTVTRGAESETLDHRPGELLLAVRDETAVGVLLGAIADLGLLPVASTRFSAEALRARGMAWVRVPDEDMPSRIAEVSAKVRDLWLASPVYEPRSTPGESDLVAPVLSTFIVRPEDGSDRDALIADVEATGVAFDAAWSGLVPPLLRFDVPPPGEGAFDLFAAIDAVPGVEAVQFDWMRLDPLQQWTPPASADADRQWSVKTLALEGAWQVTRGAGAVVAVIDSGFDLDHPALVDAFVPEEGHAWFSVDGYGHLSTSRDVTIDMTPESDVWRWHGTAVAGVIAARVVNGRGPVGVAPECAILPIRVAPMTDTTVSAGLRWAADQGADVVNLSITAAGWSDAVDVAIGLVFDEGIVICGAAGNGDGTEPDVVYPATDERVLGVGAVMPDGQPKIVGAGLEKWASRGGEHLDVMAPGLLIPTTDARGGAGYNQGQGTTVKIVDQVYKPPDGGDTEGDYVWVFTGTSAAVAHASGLAALIAAQGAADEIWAAITSSCVQPKGAGPMKQRDKKPWTRSTGFGVINAAAALAALAKKRGGKVSPKDDEKPHGGKSGGGKGDDPNIASVVKEPTDVPDVVILRGYQGPAARAGFTRVYRDLSAGEYLEIDDDDIVHRDPALEASETDKRQRFWVKQGAKVRHVRQRQRTIEATSFLEGPVSSSAAGREVAEAAGDGVWGPEPTTCTTCKTTRSC